MVLVCVVVRHLPLLCAAFELVVSPFGAAAAVGVARTNAGAGGGHGGGGGGDGGGSLAEQEPTAAADEAATTASAVLHPPLVPLSFPIVVL